MKDARLRPCAYCWEHEVWYNPEEEQIVCEYCNAMSGFVGSTESLRIEKNTILRWNEITDLVKVKLSPHSEEYIRACKELEPV